jgi:hypothetical protein
VRVIERGSILEVRDNPGCLWTFGVCFVGSGTLVIFLVLFAENRNEVPLAGLVVALMIGLAHLAGAGRVRPRQRPGTGDDT